MANAETAKVGESSSTEDTRTMRTSLEKAGEASSTAHDLPHCHRYLVLVEFVYRHLNFQMAELESILETHGIQLGSSSCQIHPLPVPKESTCSTNDTIQNQNRAFVILSFPKERAPQWSGLLQGLEDQRKNSAFQPFIDAGAKISDHCSIADILYKCTLVKSVVELWGFCATNLEDCASQAYEWLHPSEEGSSCAFQKEHIWPSICEDPERPWKFTIHTLGMKVQREEQDAMRKTFQKSLDCIQGPVKLKDPTSQEFLLIREIELDGKGSPLWAKDQHKKSFCHDAIAYYFGRVLGGRSRSSDGSRGIDQYSLKSRPYLGPTSMDAELSFVMTSLGKVKRGSVVYDPFVGTGSILLSCAMRGAYCIGSDIDIRVIRGKGGNQTIWKNFEHYGLPRPEILRTDNALYHRHYKHNRPLYDAILCDPPYGIRAGARKTGSKKDNPRPIKEENRHDHIAQTKPYVVSDVMSDLLDVAARTLTMGGRLVYIIPSFQDFDEDRDLPLHDCLEVLHTCYQPFTAELGRRIVTMKKTKEYDESKRDDYLSNIWKYGAESAEKCANLRDKIMEAARLKPGYEEKAAIRKEKRKAHKEAKKKEKRSKQASAAT